MNKYWIKKSQQEIKSIVHDAIQQNVNYETQNVLGIPASFLDTKVFNQDASFLDEAPYLFTLLQNPNHIGCHTMGKSESFFKGTQEIERKLIDICSIDILKGEENMQDGYLASGGTEANIQAIWIYRNYYLSEFSAQNDEICIICSEDSHYSMDKAANLLSIDIYKVPVDENTREISETEVKTTVEMARRQKKKYFIVVCNMMTTMFGSVDNIACYTSVLKSLDCLFKLHIDGAYGGFYYPFSNENSELNFQNSDITSFTLDAHKMAQAPYGTGVFLIRKGYMKYANTKEASYVEGQDLTLIGSRSGANAIAVWMILSKNGPFGWYEKILVLQKRTEWLCNQLESLKIRFYRNKHANIVTIDATLIDTSTATFFGLVPDDHSNPKWYKIVVMEHVTVEKLTFFIEQMRSSYKIQLNSLS